MAQRAGAIAQQAACRRSRHSRQSSSPEPVARGAAMSRAVRYWLLTEPLRETWKGGREGGRQPLHIRLLSAGSRPNSWRQQQQANVALRSPHTCGAASRQCGWPSACSGGRPQWAGQLATYNTTETQQGHGRLPSPCRRAGPALCPPRQTATPPNHTPGTSCRATDLQHQQTLTLPEGRPSAMISTGGQPVPSVQLALTPSCTRPSTRSCKSTAGALPIQYVVE